jgi:putative hydrolase of the HAD superfamily
MAAAGPSIAAVLLDVGGVFLVPDHEIYRAALTGAGLAPDADTLDRAHYAGIVAMDALGELRWSVYFEAMAVTCGADASMAPALGAALATTWERGGLWTRVLPGAVEGLTRLAATGTALAMVSNSDGHAEESLLLAGVAQVGPGPGVDVRVVIDSSVVGVEKPDPAIFSIALEAVGVGAQSAVHVGDTVLYDVRGAQQAGLRALHFDPYGLCPDRNDHEHVRSVGEVAELVEAVDGRRSS